MTEEKGEWRQCVICQEDYWQVQDMVAGFGKCDDCFWSMIEAENQMAKEWAERQDNGDEG